MLRTDKTVTALNGSSDIYSIKVLPLKQLLFVAILQLVINLSFLPVWLVVFTVLVCIYRFIVHVRYSATVSGFKKNLLFLASLAVFVSHFKFSLSVEMAASFLLLMTALKIVEVSSKKDVVVSIYTLMFVVAVSFLFEQGLFHTALQFLSLILCLRVLLSLNVGDDFRYVKAQRLYIRTGLLKSVAVSIPILVVLFLFFPRLSPLWNIPLDIGSARTGFGSSVSPGDISKLTRSSEVAFRVSFSHEPPSRSELYWRGLVLDKFDGREWTQSRYHIRDVGSWEGGDESTPNVPHYTVILEPHFEKWVFALDHSSLGSRNVVERDMGMFRLRRPAIQAVKYRMLRNDISVENDLSGYFQATGVSYERAQTNSQHDLQLPARYLNPQARAYAAELLNKSSSDKEYLVSILSSFRENVFFYSLEPPTLGEHMVDEFLFETKRGFCEHYASVVAYMMRLAGIPSRVVVGYQGGELQDGGEYMVVRQYDAHAWVEVKLQAYGWVRVDPTAMVSPDRILLGGAESFSSEEVFLADSPLSSLIQKTRLLNVLSSYMDQIKFSWQNNVVNYSQDEQSLIVSSILGEFSALNSLLMIVYLTVAFVLVFAIYLLFKKGFFDKSYIEVVYLLWLSLLSRVGYKRRVSETPREFIGRLEGSAPKFVVSFTGKLTHVLEEKHYKN